MSLAVLIVILSEHFVESYPSTAKDNNLSPVFTVITSSGGTTSGLTFNVCGQIGTIVIASSDGCKTGPPADNPYAVEPVGVDTIKPSAI